MNSDYLVSAVGDSIQKIKNMDSESEAPNKDDFKANADFLLDCVYFFKSVGIELDMHDYDNLIIKVSNEAINTAASNLEDVTKRRSDRKVEI